MKPKKKKGGKEKKPDYRKTETFQDYKSAAATFSDYNPQSDTVFVGTSIDPGMADKKAQRQGNISASKGASKASYNDTKMYRTKNEAGQDVYVSLRKYDKNEYSKGGKMKAKKKGDNDIYKSFEKKANKGNDAAKYLETGKGPNGFPLTAKTRKMYEQISKKNKNVYLMSPAPFEDDGMRKKGGKMPSYKKGGKLKKYLKGGQVKLDANKDGKITGQDFKMLKKK